MSDFTEFVHQQMEEDKTFEKIWSARNRLLGFPQHGAKTFREMDLSDAESERISLIWEHPSFDLAMDGIIRFYTAERRSQRARAAHRAKRHALVIVQYREELEKCSLVDSSFTYGTEPTYSNAEHGPIL